MALISSKLGNLVPWSACALFLHEEETGTLACRFAAGIDAPRLPLDMLEGPGSTITRAVRIWSLTGPPDRPLVSPAEGSPVLPVEPWSTESSQTGLHSAIVCPLLSNDVFIGALVLYHAGTSYYTEDHRRLLERIAGQTGAVIHNSIVFERAQEESLTDALTSLPNRRSMFAYLERELARAERMLTEVAVIVMDLDRFKSINDTYGHHVGDHALRAMAAALQAALRPYDLCVRYAGDEFVIVITDCSPTAGESKRLELQQQVSAIELEVRPNQTIHLAASAGAAVFPHDGASCETLLAEADRAMYRDKAARRGGAPARVRAGQGDERRRHVRVAGPFDVRRIGALETPVLIYDLSEGGCFIIAFHDQEIGRQFLLEIDLPQDGRVTVQAETLYNRPGFGFAVRFLDVPEQTRARIAALVERRSAPSAPAAPDSGQPPAREGSAVTAPRGSSGPRGSARPADSIAAGSVGRSSAATGS
jgi:diguanylate cyclase (GGDEF)-like protein